MERNYWEQYWDNYYKFMAVYLRELQDLYPNADIKKEYIEVANLFEPSMNLEDYEDYDQYDMDDEDENSQGVNDPPSILPEEGQSTMPLASPFIFPGMGPGPVIPPGGGQLPGAGQSPGPFISPGGGQFTINNCRRMAIVRIEMRRGFNPSNFFMVVDRADRRSIQGFRIACEGGGRIRFVPMAVEYRNINAIECAF